MDDALLLVNTYMKSKRALKLLLYEFELAYRLKINFPKSMVYQIDADQSNHDNIVSMLNCQKGSHHFNYLDVPIRLSKLKTGNSNIKKRMEWVLLIKK